MITKTSEQIMAQLDRIWKLHFTYNCGSKKQYEKADKIGYKFLSKLAY